MDEFLDRFFHHFIYFFVHNDTKIKMSQTVQGQQSNTNTANTEISVNTNTDNTINVSVPSVRKTVGVYFVYKETESIDRAIEVDSSFSWNRKFSVRDSDGYTFSLGFQPVNFVLSETERLNMNTLYVDKSGVARIRFDVSDLSERLNTDGQLKPSDEDPDWWLIVKPGMKSHKPIDKTTTNTRSQLIPTSARIRFYNNPNNKISRIDIVFS